MSNQGQTPERTETDLVARLRELEAKIRERARDYRNTTVWACESDASWHADEFEAWADELAAALASRAAAPPVSELVTCSLRSPDMVAHLPRLDCQHETPERPIG